MTDLGYITAEPLQNCTKIKYSRFSEKFHTFVIIINVFKKKQKQTNKTARNKYVLQKVDMYSIGEQLHRYVVSDLSEETSVEPCTEN